MPPSIYSAMFSGIERDFVGSSAPSRQGRFPKVTLTGLGSVGNRDLYAYGKGFAHWV